ncbi:hypothetical protein COO60DRAFT_386377 [Scenedesmus sp. NREL 46B-D3]|nr:hypothetical protein COO60DRAFT_386377 [Scenedesmus sp. NREL 46B-D3]
MVAAAATQVPRCSSSSSSSSLTSLVRKVAMAACRAPNMAALTWETAAQGLPARPKQAAAGHIVGPTPTLTRTTPTSPPRTGTDPSVALGWSTSSSAPSRTTARPTPTRTAQQQQQHRQQGRVSCRPRRAHQPGLRGARTPRAHPLRQLRLRQHLPVARDKEDPSRTLCNACGIYKTNNGIDRPTNGMFPF